MALPWPGDSLPLPGSASLQVCMSHLHSSCCRIGLRAASCACSACALVCRATALWNRPQPARLSLACKGSQPACGLSGHQLLQQKPYCLLVLQSLATATGLGFRRAYRGVHHENVQNKVCGVGLHWGPVDARRGHAGMGGGVSLQEAIDLLGLP